MRLDVRTTLAMLTVAGSVGLGLAVVTGHVNKDPAAAGQIGIVIGYVFAESKAVLAWYFSSSSSSAAKDETIQLQAQAAADVAAPSSTTTTTTKETP